LHTLELLPPKFDLFLDLSPLLLLDLAKLVGFNYDLLVLLVDLRVDDTLSNSFDRPHLDLILINVQELGQVLILKVGLFGGQRANLDV
jgi:hypothetical protein